MNPHKGPGHNIQPPKPPAPPPTPPPPPPSGTPVAELDQVITLLIARFPKYEDTGALLTGVEWYSLGTGLDPVRKALAAGQSPAKIAVAVGTIFSRYATLYVPAGPGGPGGTTCALAWGQGTGEAGYSMFMEVLFPKTPAAPKPAPPSSGPVDPGAGPGIG